MVKTAVVSWTKCETVLNIILNILVDCFLCSLSNTDWPLKLPLKVANLLINLRVGLFPAWFQLSFISPSRSWFVPNPILSTFLSSLQFSHTFQMKQREFKFDELWLVHWCTNFGSMFDLRSWKSAPFYQPSNLARLRWYWLSWQQKVRSTDEDCRGFCRMAISLDGSLYGIFRCKSPERTTSDELIRRIRSQQPLNQALCILNSRMFQPHWTLISDMESHKGLRERWPAPLFDVVICDFV